MSNIDKVKKVAQRKGIKGDIFLSPRKEKRFVIYTIHGKFHFGSKTGKTFIDHEDEAIRKAWRARHSKIISKNGIPAYKNKFSPAFYSWNLLW